MQIGTNESEHLLEKQDFILDEIKFICLLMSQFNLNLRELLSQKTKWEKAHSTWVTVCVYYLQYKVKFTFYNFFVRLKTTLNLLLIIILLKTTKIKQTKKRQL